MSSINCNVKHNFDGHDVVFWFWEKRAATIELSITADLSDASVIAALQRAQAECHRYEAYAELATLLSIHSDTPYSVFFKRDPKRFSQLIDAVIEAGIEIQDYRVSAFIEQVRPISDSNGLSAAYGVTGTGFVYLLQSPTSAYKIGRTNSPEDRMRTFGIQLPFEVEYIALIPTSDMVALERALHSRFASQRINGEWFALTPEDIEYIKGLVA